MNTSRLFATLASLGFGLLIGACSETGNPSSDHDHGDDTHSHTENEQLSDHSHETIPLGSLTISDLTMELTQGHGAVDPGEEEHLIVKFTDEGQDALTLRAWIGTEDKTRSYVGKGEYSADRGVFDFHIIAPKTLEQNAKWWIEIERPDGSVHIGSAMLVQ